MEQDNYKEHQFHDKYNKNCSSCFSWEKMSTEEKDKYLNAGTGIRLNKREIKFKTRNWTTVAEANAMKFPQNNASNIPCGYNADGEISNNCYC